MNVLRAWWFVRVCSGLKGDCYLVSIPMQFLARDLKRFVFSILWILRKHKIQFGNNMPKYKRIVRNNLACCALRRQMPHKLPFFSQFQIVPIVCSFQHTFKFFEQFCTFHQNFKFFKKNCLIQNFQKIRTKFAFWSKFQNFWKKWLKFWENMIWKFWKKSK